jgi:hypothetical protein
MSNVNMHQVKDKIWIEIHYTLRNQLRRDVMNVVKSHTIWIYILHQVQDIVWDQVRDRIGQNFKL